MDGPPRVVPRFTRSSCRRISTKRTAEINGELRVYAQTRVNTIVKFANGSSYTRRPVTNVHQQTGVKPCIRLTANYRVCRWMLACSNATRCLQWRIKNFNDTNIISNLRYHNTDYCRSIDKFDSWFLILNLFEYGVMLMSFIEILVNFQIKLFHF